MTTAHALRNAPAWTPSNTHRAASESRDENQRARSAAHAAQRAGGREGEHRRQAETPRVGRARHGVLQSQSAEQQHGAGVEALAPHGVRSLAPARPQPEDQRRQAEQLEALPGAARPAAQLGRGQRDLAPVAGVVRLDAVRQQAHGTFLGAHDGSACRRAKAIRAFAAKREASPESSCSPAGVSR